MVCHIVQISTGLQIWQPANTIATGKINFGDIPTIHKTSQDISQHDKREPVQGIYSQNSEEYCVMAPSSSSIQNMQGINQEIKDEHFGAMEHHRYDSLFKEEERESSVMFY